ncbi:MAG: thioredoxin family protein [Halanaeroarchaeum sp.]
MESMEPNPAWDPEANAHVVEAYADLPEDAVVKVWGADWCPDTRNTLPDFAAALDAAGVGEERIHQYEVDRDKNGEGTEEYGIELIPTIVVERDDEELARFVEEEAVPPAVYLAGQFSDVDLAQA